MQFSGMTISARVRQGGQAADREASSCNAAQLPRFLVCFYFFIFLARDAYRTNRRAIAMMFVRPSACLSLCLSGTTVYIVIIWFTLAQI